ncbi:cellulose synthase regulator protein [Cedecea neteri]|uniref:Cyclic di-GMP-binding protein n=1 Tax=Cedecea neteri TaxID=158822 RepID=A0A2X2T0F8_9ENTR|nr:cellulose synthase regulator protein [Cedecea neteri]
MQLMMNGQPLGSVPLGAADSNVTSYQLDIPAALVVSSNNINLKINDADALLCQRDLTDSNQVTIMPAPGSTSKGSS